MRPGLLTHSLPGVPQTAIAEKFIRCNHLLVNQYLASGLENSDDSRPSERVRDGLLRSVRRHPSPSPGSSIAIGAFAALVAVGIRFSLPLEPTQIPTLAVVVALAIVTTFVGIVAGITTAVLGGLLSWYLFFTPLAWSLAHQAWIPILAYGVIATVIVTTSHLYRSSERLHHEKELSRLRAEAVDANLFAREMAHRLKNALTIVQSIAFQTIGTEGVDAAKFAGRLKALADANELLTEHVEMPTAKVREVIDAALRPFHDEEGRFSIEGTDGPIRAQQVVSLALGIHELATNACKYGALSNHSGRVALRIEEAGERLKLVWAEVGGPRVSPPVRNGFGMRLLRRTGMNAKLEFEPDGLVCAIEVRKA